MLLRHCMYIRSRTAPEACVSVSAEVGQWQRAR